MPNRNVLIHTGAQTATGNSGPIKATSETLTLAFDVTAFSGTAATMDITVQWSPDGTNFAEAATPDAIAQITGVGFYNGKFNVKAPWYRVVYTMGGDVVEVQAVTHDHTGGTFTLSYDGEGPTAAIDWDAPVASVAAEGLLTIAVKPSAGVAAATTLTIDTKPIDGDTMTLDTITYTFKDVIAAAYDVYIGATVATAKVNIVAAINHAVHGTAYYAGTELHPTVSIATFIADDAVVTAKAKGTDGNAIVSTSVFDEVTNKFSATTLGDTVAGVEPDTVTVDAVVYTFLDTLTGAANEVAIGLTLATAQANLVAAMADHATVDIAAFATPDAVLTAVTAGTAGNALASTETFASASNFFDATTLGAETLGVNGVETELELFTNITDVTVVRNGNGDWDVSFPSLDGDVAMITIDDTNLTGGSTSGVAESTKGVNSTATFAGTTTHFDTDR